MTKHPQQLELFTAEIIRFPVRIVIDLLRDCGIGGAWLNPANRRPSAGESRMKPNLLVSPIAADAKPADLVAAFKAIMTPEQFEALRMAFAAEAQVKPHVRVLKHLTTR
jgi:hypothetical protein